MTYDFSQHHIQLGDKDYPEKHNGAMDALEELGNDVISKVESAGNSKDAAAASAASALSSKNHVDRLVAGDFADVIRYSKIDNPLVHLFKKNKLVDTLQGNLSHTRDSGATYIDRYGVLKHSPSPYATNLCLYSEDLDKANGVWDDSHSNSPALTGRSLIAKSVLLQELYENNTGAQSYLYQSVTLDPDTKYYTVSTLLSKGTSGKCRVIAALSGGATITVVVDNDNMSIDSTTSGFTSHIEHVEGSVYRVSIVFQNTGNTIVNIRLVPADIGNGSVGSTYFGGIQLEKSKVANGYAKTLDVPVSGHSYVGIDITRQEKEGWRFEGGSTNLIPYSEFDGGYPVNSGSSQWENLKKTKAGIIFNKFIKDAAQYRDTPSTSTTATFSAFVYDDGVNESQTVRLGVIGDITQYSSVSLNFETKELTVSGSSTGSGRFEYLGGGVYRLEATVINASVDNVTALRTAIYGSGDWYGGFQLEELPFASSYMPTTDAPATRVGSTNAIPYKGNIPRGDQPFTFVFSGVIDGYTSFNRLFDTNTADTNSRLYAFCNKSGGIQMTNGSDTGIAVTTPITFGEHFTYIVTFDGVTFKSYLNGALQNSSLAVEPAAVMPQEFRIMKGSNTLYDSYGTCSTFNVYDFPFNQLEVSLASGE